MGQSSRNDDVDDKFKVDTQTDRGYVCVREKERGSNCEV